MTGHIAMADFYMTFCTLSGHPDCTDSPGNGVPPSESYDMWPLLSGATEASPRTETVLEFRPSSNATPSLLHDAALVQGDWKYIQGRQVPFSCYVPCSHLESWCMLCVRASVRARPCVCARVCDRASITY
jgi:hypothetical protein